MRRVFLLAVLAALLMMAAPVSGVTTLTINASPTVAHIGETIALSGTVNGTPTIAVFLFVTGPDLDPRGVALDNFNVPAGRGMFTTAPVQMSDGTWTYIWDTSITLGTPKPGRYTVYVVDTPVDRLRFIKAGYASTEIEFLPSEKPAAETPLDPVLPVVALVCVGISLSAFGMRQK